MAKYERIAADIRAKIAAGDYPAGERLPPETDLQAAYRVSLNTLRQALSVLRAEGAIESRHGVGTYVRMPSRRVTRSPDRYHAEKRRARLPEDERRGQGAVEDDTGLQYEDIAFAADFDAEPASSDLAAAFGVPSGTLLLVRTYQARSRREDRPLHLIRSYLVHEVAARNPDLLREEKEPWPGGTQHQLSTIGIEVGSITDRITARPPTAIEAELLAIPAGTALICIRKISTATTGGAVEISDILLPADRTELVYTTQLEPW
jgi:GntR family transcriptional regulator